jgi:hydroxymethylbilane synthase
LRNKVTIATRTSRLARVQTDMVAEQLKQKFPHLQVDIYPVVTKGDRIQDKPLSALGGKGLFVKELERAILSGKADMAVHSLKDMPGELPEGLVIGAVTEREDPRDVFISNRYHSLAELPEGAVLGTSSLRRSVQMLHERPDLNIRTLRGNVDTRLRKLDAGQYDAIILAAAGVIRLGLRDRITAYIPEDICVPACGQGIMAMEIRQNDRELLDMVQTINNREAFAEMKAERAFLKAMGGSCHIPAGMISHCRGSEMTALAMTVRPSGKGVQQVKGTGSSEHPEELGQRMAKELGGPIPIPGEEEP